MVAAVILAGYILYAVGCVVAYLKKDGERGGSEAFCDSCWKYKDGKSDVSRCRSVVLAISLCSPVM